MPPRVRLVPTPTGLRAEVEDAVTAPEGVQLSWSVGGAAFGPYGAPSSVEVPEGSTVAVKARDRAGNVALATRVAGVITAEPRVADEGGCSIARHGAPGILGLGLLALLGLLACFVRRWR